ncbi:hypothetical protein [uncultured Algibacter sp.]|uniref:hypothetical protein n=1 Tax=uncultured Algibacter sp. TaxID=298659 RepID=UPI00262A2603|nr:hypothetical protein [uncultured Algibacter sp.]
MKKYIFLFALSIVLYSCSSNDGKPTNENDFLIFGHFYGFCAGEECIEIFKLTDTKLYEDTEDNYALDTFNFEEKDNEKFNLVKDLIDSLPEKLLTEKDEIIGCPDCSDGGGIFIEYSKNGVINSWRIDQFKRNIPEYLHDFTDRVNEKISLINK